MINTQQPSGKPGQAPIDDWVILQTDKPFDYLNPTSWLRLYAAQNALTERIRVTYA